MKAEDFDKKFDAGEDMSEHLDLSHTNRPGSKIVKSLKRNFFQRLFGIPATAPPGDPGCWEYASGQLTIDLRRAPELARPGGAIRLEGHPLPVRILVVRDEQGLWRAYRNRCRHGGRRLDPVPGTDSVQCCSVSKGTYDLEGNLVAGPGRGPLTVYPVENEGDRLLVDLSEE